MFDARFPNAVVLLRVPTQIAKYNLDLALVSHTFLGGGGRTG